MNKVTTPIIAVVVLLVLGGGIFYFQSQRGASTEKGQTTQEVAITQAVSDEIVEEDVMVEKDATEEGTMKDGEKQITLAEIAEHDSSEDCWFAIEGKVYDVTDYIAGEKHPGGAALLQGCGTDATEIFNERPNGSGSHSDKARGFLPNFVIGELVEEK